jgi:hypothetical protein
MDGLMVTMRILHIVFATYWVGTDVFLTFILLPRLRALGSAFERPVMASLLRILPPVLMISAVLTFAAGVVITGLLTNWNISLLFVDGWGWSIFAGIVATFIAMIIGFGVIPFVTIRMEKINKEIEGRKELPTAEEEARLTQLTDRLTVFGNTNTVLLFIAVGSMAVARFV